VPPFGDAAAVESEEIILDDHAVTLF